MAGKFGILVPILVVVASIIVAFAIRLDFLSNSWLFGSLIAGPLQRPSREAYDFVIIGAGAAGSLLAARLADDPSTTVLIIEAGATDKHPLVDVPLSAIFLLESERDWRLQTEPQGKACLSSFCTQDQKHTGKRGCCKLTIGKMLGGSGSLNVAVWVRGHAKDFDDWEGAGAQGWNSTSVLPFFKRSESSIEFGGSALRGSDGPLRISSHPASHPITQGFLDACHENGLPSRHDFNGETQEGCSAAQSSIYRGSRQSTSKQLLWPAMSKPNLDVVTEAKVSKVEIICSEPEKEGCTARGVVFKDKAGVLTRVRANKEVVLSAGATFTPQLLMLSGIGNKRHLDAFGIPCKINLAGVGQGLEDHPWIRLRLAVSKPISMRKRETASLANVLNLLLRGEGPLAHGPGDVFAFLKTKEGADRPDVQAVFGPGPGMKEVCKLQGIELQQQVEFEDWSEELHGMTIVLSLIHPKSRGSVALRSADPRHPPRVDLNFFDDPTDMATLVAGIRTVLALLHSPAMLEFTDGNVSMLVDWDKCPGSPCRCPPANLSAAPDSFWECFIMHTAQTQWHQSCTAKMGGLDDPLAVLDSRLRVRHAKGLRVVDSSAFPSVPGGNIYAATVMLAEKAADMIIADHRLRVEGTT